jgi:hypothetical protein
MKGKSPQGARVTVQIELFNSAFQHNWRVVLLLLRQRRGSLQACIQRQPIVPQAQASC